jgi:cobalamin biosynthesis Mg chelatase CobN
MNETFGCPINKAVIVMTEVDGDGAVLLPSSAGENTYVADILALLLQEKNGTYNVQPAETTSSQPAPVGASPEQPPLVGAPVGQSNGETTNGETTNGETTNGETNGETTNGETNGETTNGETTNGETTADEQALADLIIPTTTTVGETTNEETTNGETTNGETTETFKNKKKEGFSFTPCVITLLVFIIILVALYFLNSKYKFIRL